MRKARTSNHPSASVEDSVLRAYINRVNERSSLDSCDYSHTSLTGTAARTATGANGGVGEGKGRKDRGSSSTNGVQAFRESRRGLPTDRQERQTPRESRRGLSSILINRGRVKAGKSRQAGRFASRLSANIQERLAPNLFAQPNHGRVQQRAGELYFHPEFISDFAHLSPREPGIVSLGRWRIAKRRCLGNTVRRGRSRRNYRGICCGRSAKKQRSSRDMYYVVLSPRCAGSQQRQFRRAADSCEGKS